MAHGATGEFVEGWLVAQLLGEGAYGEVRLLVHARSGAAVALKAVRGAGGAGGGAGEGAAREAALHRALRHAHVVRCLGARAHAGTHYMFLEYCAGGELFDRIEPARGMRPAAARRYWRQLLLGLRYLHARGVAHRDIKPENLLLDARDTLKISDFGMATLFRHGARERLLARVCGTLPYAAPEVLRAARRPYRAPPADLWAAAVVLRAMLTGELPWERAHPEDARFAAWAGGVAGAEGGEAAALLRRALQPEAARRASLDQLLLHEWTAPLHGGDEERAWRSQPAPAPAPAPASPPSPAGEAGEAGELSAADMDALISHSQPAHSDDLLLGGTPPAAAGQGEGEGVEGALARLARRRTRVWVRGGAEAALGAAAAALAGAGLAARRPHPRLLALECEGGLRMRAWPALQDRDRTLLEFRRWRGCGMHFKRRFADVREALRPLEPPGAPPPAPPEPMDY